MPFGINLIIILLTLILSAVLVAYEMALASISRARLTVLVNQRKRGAQEALFMKDRMEASLAVVQLFITLMSALAAALGGAGATEWLSPYFKNTFGFSGPLTDLLALLLLIVPLSFLTILFAELIPKTYALKNKVWVCLTLSPPMKVIYQLAYPIVTILEKTVKSVYQFISRRGLTKSSSEEQPGLHELAAAVAMARTSRVIGAREEKIVLSAAHLSIRPIKEIMIPIADVSMIAMDSSLSDALIRAHLDMHTRFPVYIQEGNPQTIQGYVNFKDIMMALKLNPEAPNIRGIVRPLKTVTDDKRISQVLEELIQEKLHITLVAAKDGRIVGIVTLEDILEELVGEIEDEFDRLSTYIHPYGGGWIMGGGVSMAMLAQTVGATPANEDSGLRLADWAVKKWGRPLEGGEIIPGDGFQVMVRKLRRKKLGEAVVTVDKK